jgi:hypothetical protein
LYSNYLEKYNPDDVYFTLKDYSIDFCYIEFGFQNKCSRINYEFYVGLYESPKNLMGKFSILRSHFHTNYGYFLSRFIPFTHYFSYRGYGNCTEGRRFYVGGFQQYEDFDFHEFKTSFKAFTPKPPIKCIQIFYDHGSFDGYVAFNSTEYLENSRFKNQLIYHGRPFFMVEIQKHKDNSHKYLELALKESS